MQPSGSSEVEQSPVVRSETVWYDDGNLIIQAQNVRFRVHRSVLARQSTVFRDMIEVAAQRSISDIGHALGENDQFSVDGVTLVHLSDTSEEVDYLLQAVYDRSIVSVNDETGQTFRELCPLITAVLRLSTKYLIPSLRTRAVAIIASTYPFDLDIVEEKYALRDTGRTYLGHWQDHEFLYGLGLQTAVRLANVLEEISCHTPLLVLVILLSMELDAAGVFSTALSPINTRRVLISRDFMKSVYTKSTAVAASPNLEDCTKLRVAVLDSCQLYMMCLIRCHLEFYSCNPFIKPLSSMRRMVETATNHTPCDTCASRLENFWADGCATMWENLPKVVMNVESWAVLQERDSRVAEGIAEG